MKKRLLILLFLFSIIVSFSQSVGDVIITEIIQNPATVSDARGEWIEIYNTTAVAININGWILKDDGANTHTINSGGPLNIASHDYLVLGRNSDPILNGGVTLDYKYSSFTLGNSADQVVLIFGALEIDRVNYDGGGVTGSFPDPTGKSMTLQIDKYNSVLNDNGYNWCEATTAFGAGDLGTPGLANNTYTICECSNKEKVTYETTGLWSNGAGPSLITDVLFKKNYNTTSGNIEACNCKVNSGKIITVSDGTFMKFYSQINNVGIIRVENEGALVQVDDAASIIGSGTFQIKKTTPTYISYDYTYWSSPIENATLSTVLSANPQNYIFSLNTSLYSDEFNDNTYPQTTGIGDTHDDDNNSWVATTGAMTVGSGYIAMGEGSVFPFVPPTPADTHTQSVSFDGKINNGIINVNVFKDLYNVTNGVGDSFNTNANLIGNPYPSAIDINKLMANNASVLQGTFYFWTHDSSINSANP